MQEQTVLITGASRGIGLEIALFLRNLGYRVIGTSTNSRGVQLIDQALGPGGKGIETVSYTHLTLPTKRIV